MDGMRHRLGFAIAACRRAGETAASRFAARDRLAIEAKGPQDWVSEADREVEALLRGQIAAAWPDDAIVGEEHGAQEGRSGFVWVIDPIDGTTNFISGIPAWAVVLAGVSGGRVRLGVIHDPVHGETFAAIEGGGATLNGAPIGVRRGTALAEGSVAIGLSGRTESRHAVALVAGLLGRGALFCRTGSGALSLAWVAAGRYLGYVEEHMNAWDCLAGQLLVREAGGRIEAQDADRMIREGGRVIAAGADLFDALRAIAEEAWR